MTELVPGLDFEISFEDSSKAPVRLKSGAPLSEFLDIQNSPILFGCRTGICGTCAIEICDEKGGPLHPRTQDEEEYLSAIAPDRPKCRLACQIRLNTNLCIRKVEI
jgi:ferredoxin